jgi:lysyl-tRNA synthetase class 1
MFWADRITDEILKKHRGKKIIIRDEKTASGRVHVGSMRGVAIHGVIAEILKERGIDHEFFYEINDFDPMDGLPVYLDKNVFEKELGKPLYKVPSPDSKEKNFAEFYGKEFEGVIAHADFHPTYYRGSDVYLSGKMNGVIREALDEADMVRQIYKSRSGSVKDENWLPLNVICENCGKVSTTKASDWNGDTVTYSCEDLEWTRGCGNIGKVSPFDGKAKLPWKVEWAAKWKVHGVLVEGGGKDHSTKGGSRDVANYISKEVFKYEPPFDIPYEFFLVGGAKMSSSKGQGSSALEIADLLPPHIFRLALLQKDIKQAINFDPAGDTIPVLFDTYDKLAENAWAGTKDDNARLFELTHNTAKRFLPRFSQVAFIVQMKHMNVLEEVSKMKGSELTEDDKKEVEERAKYAEIWLSTYAPEDFRYELQENMPEAVKNFSDAQKNALREILSYLQGLDKFDGQEIHTKLHDIRKSQNIEPKDFFSALYISFLGKDSGPKAGWFLSVLDKTYVEKRLREVIQ